MKVLKFKGFDIYFAYPKVITSDGRFVKPERPKYDVQIPDIRTLVAILYHLFNTNDKVVEYIEANYPHLIINSTHLEFTMFDSIGYLNMHINDRENCFQEVCKVVFDEEIIEAIRKKENQDIPEAALIE